MAKRQIFSNANAKKSIVIPTLKKCQKKVRRFQKQILKAWLAKDVAKLEYVCQQLMNSFEVTYLAVKTSTRGKKGMTPGVDGVKLITQADKIRAANLMQRVEGYRAKPLRRIYLDKETGQPLTAPWDPDKKTRPISMLTQYDRIMQTKAKWALEPITEYIADQYSYGFRPKRSAKDALNHCQNLVRRNPDLQYVLEGDIKACFDEINHQVILDLIPIWYLKPLVKQWLTCGSVFNGELSEPQERGTPQGSILSPLLANLVLDGMEGISMRFPGCYFVRYADDFIVFSKENSNELLTLKLDDMILSEVKEKLSGFLAERGLTLSPEKTLTTSILEGFDFLGVRLQSDDQNMKLKPSKKSIERLLAKIDLIWAKTDSASRDEFNLKIEQSFQGWVGYHKGWLKQEDVQEVRRRIQIVSERL